MSHVQETPAETCITITRSVWHHSFTRLLFLMASFPSAIPVITHLSSWGRVVCLFSLWQICIVPMLATGRCFYLYDELGDWLCDDFEQLRRFLARLEAETGHQSVRQPGHQAARRLQRQQGQNREPVEAVVDGCPSEGAVVGHKRVVSWGQPSAWSPTHSDCLLICFAWLSSFGCVRRKEHFGGVFFGWVYYERLIICVYFTRHGLSNMPSAVCRSCPCQRVTGVGSVWTGAIIVTVVEIVLE